MPTTISGTTGVSQVQDGSIGTADLVDGSVTTAKHADGSVTPAKLSQPLTLATAQNTTSGTSIDFTGIPSWVKRITVMFSGVSTTGTSPPQLQIGTSSGVETSGYLSTNFNLLPSGSPAGAAFTAAFGIGVSTGQWASTVVVQGNIVLSLLKSSTNTWTASGALSRSDVTTLYVTSGSKSLAGTLDRIRLTTANGTDTFDAGSVNILYEG